MPLHTPGSSDILRFDEAIVSFNGYSLGNVPRILFTRISEIIQHERKPMNEACEAIAHILKATREDVRIRLTTCQASSQDALYGPRRRPEAWPATRNFYRLGSAK